MMERYERQHRDIFSKLLETIGQDKEEEIKKLYNNKRRELEIIANENTKIYIPNIIYNFVLRKFSR